MTTRNIKNKMIVYQVDEQNWTIDEQKSPKYFFHYLPCSNLIIQLREKGVELFQLIYVSNMLESLM